MNAPIRLAMIGGGLDAFIGSVHRHAAALDGRFRLVAGALSRDPAKAKRSAEEFGIDPARSHTSIESLIDGEAARPADERAELIAIVTPNHTHHLMAMACLNAGFGVLIEKPMTVTSAQARDLREHASELKLPCVVMYNYTGYPMVREARARIASGELGTIRKVFVEYHQGWLSTRAETDVPQAMWRTDPALAGLGGALGDIGTHAENIVRFTTGLEIESLCADLTSFVEGRTLDDDAAALLRFTGGAKGVLTASQVCAGEGNGFSLRVYGDKGGLRWQQQTPEELELLSLDGPTRVFTRGGPGLGPDAVAASRIPVGHPEGFIEAFANVYRGAASQVEARRQGCDPHAADLLVPTAEAGQRGVRFIELCVESARAGSTWVDWSD